MPFYKFTIKASRTCFMEPDRQEVHEHYIAADTYDQAHAHVWDLMRRGGWHVMQISGKQIILRDIRQPDAELEDKQAICNKLLPALQATRAGSDLVKLEYQQTDDGSERVVATYDSGYKRVANITGDSGGAMIGDILMRIT